MDRRRPFEQSGSKANRTYSVARSKRLRGVAVHQQHGNVILDVTIKRADIVGEQSVVLDADLDGVGAGLGNA